ncbi:MAG: U32 family peptidase [Clostridia bacterium]|nr:U32 family peptidase [Clostridia bacterium]
MQQKMELLAPVGGMDQLKAAVRFGADAVYGGMKRYGLRAFAGNFDTEQLKEATSFCHAHGVKFYVTMNILAQDEQLSGMAEAAQEALSCGVDAAIVSDLGVASLLHQTVPELAIHVSTQANITNASSAKLWQQVAGVERIVLSRELSMEQIAAMRRKLSPELELEAFVHGAMCVAYSGRCLLSAVMLGRSGNKGACAQPCRWQYHVVEEKRPGEYMPVCEDEHGTYLFSACDLCMLPHLPELQKAGIASLKIEGRMKTAYYVATVVSAYRRALDLLEKQGEDAYRAALPALMEELQKASHRTSNTGFYFGDPTPPAGAAGFSQSMEYVGDIISDAAEGEEALVRLKNRFYVGDSLEALTPQGNRSFIVTSMILAESGESVTTASVAGTLIKMVFPFAVGAGDLLRGPNRNHRT